MFQLNNPYNREDAISFLSRNFLPDDYEPCEQRIYVEQKTIKKGFILGNCESLNLQVLELWHDSENDPRVTITKEAFKLLQYCGINVAALVFVISEKNPSNYRFSLIYFDYNEADKKEFSNPRRYSFCLGKDVPCHTANEFLIKPGRVTSLDDLKSRFSVEVLTKSFYKELSDWYAWALMKGEVGFPDCPTTGHKQNKDILAQNLIRLVTRMLFVWFLKQKGLVPDVLFDKDYLQKHVLKDFKLDCESDDESLFEHTTNTSMYYKAILQNLFFATLNCPIVKEGTSEYQRGFRVDGQHHGVNYLMRYKKYFQNPEQFVSMMNDQVPYLNGALFECLDDKLSNPPNYIDGFSDGINPSLLTVPDYYFFGVSKADISAFYSDKPSKSEKKEVFGLIDILKKYNFTVEENTSNDVEVSLDPELLGKVFENLLASYNTETKENARKKTGSFYTPREIVDFMVDESLVAYFKSKTNIEENFIRKLLTYDFRENRDFIKTINTDELVKAIFHCKVLDMACGSGAFPMGVLQRLVYLLQTLDPNNTFWKRLILTAFNKETEKINKAEISEDDKIEQQTDINESFNSMMNNPDYSRKLYLIEQCIYGIDIQPIAVQISKLRFFISLIVEQRPTKDNKMNFGIRPLPNLDAKIVAADSLLQLKKSEDSLFSNDKIQEIQQKQKTAVHKLFRARTAKTKKKYETLIKYYRAELVELLSEEGVLGNEDAQIVGEWDIFDQNSTAKFFDIEWMFGMDRKFNIIIGNPPYIQLQNDDGALAKKYEKFNYESFARTGDIYCLFYERGLDLLENKGVLTFITSNKWMRAEYGSKLRGFLAKHNPQLLIDFAGTKVFESATVDTNILLVSKEINSKKTKAIKLSGIDKFDRINMSDYIKHNYIINAFSYSSSWIIENAIEHNIKSKIMAKGTPLKEWEVSINYGIKTGYNKAFIISTETKENIIANCHNSEERQRTEELIRPILRGKDIERFGFKQSNLFLISMHNGIKRLSIPKLNIDDYPAVKKYMEKYIEQLVKRTDKGDTPYNLRNCDYMEDFSKPKLVWTAVNSEYKFTIVPPGYYINNSLFMIISEKQEMICGLMNSKLFKFYFQTVLSSGVYNYGSADFFKSIPILNDELLSEQITELVKEIYSTEITKRHYQIDKLDNLIFDSYNLSNEEIQYINENLSQ